MATGKANWEKQILQQIEENRKVTYLGAAHPQLSPEEHPNFKVYEFSPNKSLDGNERYLLAGPEWSIMQQSSMLKALHDMLGRRLGYTLDFEVWFAYFEYEFITALPPKSRPPKTSWKPWGKDVKNRPKKLNLMDKREAAKAGYMAIRFWKDRSVESNSKVLVGTYTELKQQLMNEMTTVQAEVETYGIPTISYQESFTFVPQIMLFFIEDSEDVDPNFIALRARISFRVKGETNESITEAKALTLANKIKVEFGTNNSYVWKKGKVMCSYIDKVNGYWLQLRCRDKATGRELITKLLSIQSVTFDSTKMNTRENENPSEAYPTLPPTKRIYGENHRLPRKMPIGDVRFQLAELHIWGKPRPVTLVDLVGIRKEALVKG
ncbi:MAG: hypothetical protein ACOVQ7_15490 [Limnoraphis robusta]|jgi:hypothetical protein